MDALQGFNQLGEVHGELLLEDGQALICRQLLRRLPGKRWVIRGEWQGKAVVAKIFAGTHALRYANRDAQGVLWLADANIKTPQLYWQGRSLDAQRQVLIFQAILDAQSAEVAYRQASQPQRRDLICKLSQVLATQHQAQLRQADLHLDNFLLQQAWVWSIDGDGILHQAISPKRAFHDLATLLSKLPVLDQVQFAKVAIDAYQQILTMQPPIVPAQLLATATRIHQAAAWKYAAKKVFRSCSDVVWQTLTNGVMAASRLVDNAMASCTPDQLGAMVQRGQVLKAGNTCTVVKSQWQASAVVIKRYNIKNAWHAICRAWRPSRAAMAWRNAHLLRYVGIATPAPLCLLETRYFGLRGKAYFVASYSPWPDAASFFKQTMDESLRHLAIQQLVTLCYQFYWLQLSHGDFKASNLQISERGQVMVLDLDSLQWHRCPYWAMRRHAKDIQRLLQNWKADASLYNALIEQFNVIYTDARPLKLAGIANS